MNISRSPRRDTDPWYRLSESNRAKFSHLNLPLEPGTTNVGAEKFMVAVDDIRLRWVLAHPSRKHAADPIGMGAQADRIADFLLPQLSGATGRAATSVFSLGRGKITRQRVDDPSS